MLSIKNLSQIKYLLAIISLSKRSADNTLAQANQVFVWKINWQYFAITYLKDQRTIKNLLQIKYLSAIMSLSERSTNNTLAQANQVFVWKINWQYFAITYLKDQRTMKNLSQMKYLPKIKYLLAIMSLSERSADNTLARTNQVFVWKINWQYFGSG